LVASGDQAMRVATMRDAPPVACHCVQFVAVHHEDLRVHLGEHFGGKQAGQSPAKYHRAVNALLRHRDLFLLCGQETCVFRVAPAATSGDRGRDFVS
jgi:hypothetical protein